MSKIIELRNKRNTLWEQTKAFLEEHRNENGLVEAGCRASDYYHWRCVSYVRLFSEKVKNSDR